MLAPGQIIDGKYRIERCLAEGGMGAVYLGQNTRIGRQVAIKVLHGTLAKQGVQVERFEQEAQLLARIGSQYIVEVLDMGDLPSGDSYMVMEYLEGESLGDRLHRRKKLPAEEAAQIVEQALTGLEAAHGAGVIHRDIKPDNLFLQRRPEGELVKILDFGVSKLQLDTQELRQSKLTLNGTLVGTPQYMSPEQARGHETDHHTDIFAMGIVLFECLAGETPFVGDNMHDLLFKVALEEPRTLASLCPDVDPKLDSIVRRATARSPENRYASARDFRDALRDWLDERGAASVRPRTPANLHLRRIPTFARVPSPRISDTPANWSTPPRGIASRPDLDAPDSSELPASRNRRTPWVVGGALAVAAAAALAISALSTRPGEKVAAAAEPTPAPVVSATPAVTVIEAPTAPAATATVAQATTGKSTSGTSGRSAPSPASPSLAAASLAAQRGLRPTLAAISSATEVVPAPAASAAAAAPPAAASAAPAAAPAPSPDLPGVSAPPPTDPSPAAPPATAAPPPPAHATGPAPAVIPSTPKGRVFRRDL